MLRLGTSLVRHGARSSSWQAAPAVAVATVRLSALSRGGAAAATARVAPTTGVWARHGAIGGSHTHFVRHLSSGSEEVIPVPSMGDSISEGTIVEWAKQPGDSVELDEVVVVLETDKVSIDVRAPSAGTLVEQMAADGDTVEVGAPLMKLDTAGGGGGGGAAAAAPAPKAAEPPKEPGAAAAPKPSPAPKPAPPPAAAAAAPAPAAAPAAGQKVALPPISPAANGDRTESRVKMTRMRMRIAERLKSAQNTAAMLTTFQEVGKLGPPKKGFFWGPPTPQGGGGGGGGGDRQNHRGFADVEKAIAEYGRKAKEGSLALEDMAGGSFTISNGGVFGSLMGTPIINPPQSAILGMHATKMRAVVGPDGQVVARPMMYLALTYDHRLIDGREAVTFLKSVALKVQDPTRLLLDL
ncbi:2-oxoglutarate dehydrogenase, E2 component [Ectocarpus siliculosus]|uniref:Dihydrolipoamide acetyltransferase component of pyruvate dehydrogenase complex n=1 Tax=Ectocarpus siliculosus TaxID=2880 RepID=D7G687_ECTSI|nr:2-oxoglutarate dehydrogenase, E2 component [Ectocarpus siliculosus]|eukprot:CBJ27482.1 2-oxoglutarate dehydrogenase, E2 component [Ectocarpus siliculosus]